MLRFFRLHLSSATDQGIRPVNIIPVIITRLKIKAFMPRFTLDHNVTILKIGTIPNIRRKMPKNLDKQNLVMKRQMKAEVENNMIGNMITWVVPDVSQKLRCNW